MKGAGTGGQPGAPVPRALENHHLALSIFTNETPVPLVALQRLWQLSTLGATQQVVEQLQGHNVLRLASLPDGSIWCMITQEAYKHLQVASSKEAQTSFHRRLLNGYMKAEQAGGKAVPLHRVLDDGYIMQQVAHHLLGAQWGAEIQKLLCDPDWLEAKLHAYGTTALLVDFQRYFEEVDDGNAMRLLLNALHLSLTRCLEHPEARMMRQQMVARLLAVPKTDSWLQTWYTDQTARVAEELAAAALGDLTLSPGVRSAERGSLLPLHMLPRSATLQQAGGPNRMALHGHSGAISGLVAGLRGQDVITFSDDGLAQMWDLNIGHSKLQLQESVAFTAAATAEGGAVCVLGGGDGTCWVWDLNTGDVKRTLLGHQGRVSLLAVDRRGLRATSFSSEDGVVLSWDLTAGKCEHQLVGGATTAGDMGTVQCLDVSASGALVAAGCDCFHVHVWALAGPRGDAPASALPRKHLLSGHSSWVVSLAFAGASTRLVSASHDMEARVWEATSGVCLRVLSGHTGRLNHVQVDVLGEDAVTSSDDGTVRLWDMRTGACKKVLRTQGDAWINWAAISRDGKKVVGALGDNTVAVWDTSSGKCDATLEGHCESVTKVVLTQRGATAVTFALEEGAAIVWDLDNAKLSTVTGHQGKVRKLVELPDGKVVSSSEDGSITTWEAAEGIPELAFRQHTSSVGYMSVTTDGTAFLSGSGDRQVCRWGLPGVRCATVLPLQQGSRVKSMAFDGAGRHAIVVLFDSTVAVWDLQTGTCVADLMRRAERDGNRVHSGAVNNAYLSRDGRMAATVAKDNAARIWDVQTGACCGIIDAHKDSVVTAALAEMTAGGTGGTAAATAAAAGTAAAGPCFIATASTDGIVCLTSLLEWRAPLAAAAAKATTTAAAAGTDAKSKDALRVSIGSPPVLPSVVLKHAGAVPLLALSQTNRWLAVAVDGGAGVTLWPLKGAKVDGGTSRQLPHASGDVSGLVFSPDGSCLVTFCGDTVWMWQCIDGQPLAFFVADAPITAGCFVRFPSSGSSRSSTDNAGGKGALAISTKPRPKGVLALGDAIGVVHFVDMPVPCF